MGSELIRQDVRDFEAAVKNLSAGIASASALWKDAKYRELSASVGQIARQSRDLITAGDDCCSAIDHFLIIANEKY